MSGPQGSQYPIPIRRSVRVSRRAGRPAELLPPLDAGCGRWARPGVVSNREGAVVDNLLHHQCRVQSLYSGQC